MVLLLPLIRVFSFVDLKSSTSQESSASSSNLGYSMPFAKLIQSIKKDVHKFKEIFGRLLLHNLLNVCNVDKNHCDILLQIRKVLLAIFNFFSHKRWNQYVNDRFKLLEFFARLEVAYKVKFIVKFISVALINPQNGHIGNRENDPCRTDRNIWVCLFIINNWKLLVHVKYHRKKFDPHSYEVVPRPIEIREYHYKEVLYVVDGIEWIDNPYIYVDWYM